MIETQNKNWKWCNVGNKMCGAKFLTFIEGKNLCYGEINYNEPTETCNTSISTVEDKKLLDDVRTSISQVFEERKKQNK